ncbi:MAG: class I SAM-dependent methyltransferase [Pseudomonadota bacterium]
MSEPANTYQKARQILLNALPKGGVGVEIGVWKGDFSARLLQVAAPRTLHLLDPWQINQDEAHAKAWYGRERGIDMDEIHASVMARFKAEIAAERVVIHRASSIDAMASFDDGTLDFVYVDGDHAYDAVRADLEIAVQKVRPKGVICADDHMLGRWWGDGVVRAVNEVLGAHPRSLTLVFAANGQVMIEKR